MKDFNIKIFAIQLVASVLLFLGIQQFYVLAELDLIELIHSMGKDNFAFWSEKVTNSNQRKTETFSYNENNFEFCRNCFGICFMFSD